MPARVTVYTYAGCGACRDAVNWLRGRGVDFVARPIYTDPPTVGELHRMLAAQGGQLRRLCNTSGLEYRALGLAAKLPTLSIPAALALLAGNGKLVKRPFLLGPSLGLVGFDAARWSEAFPPRAPGGA